MHIRHAELQQRVFLASDFIRSQHSFSCEKNIKELLQTALTKTPEEGIQEVTASLDINETSVVVLSELASIFRLKEETKNKEKHRRPFSVKKKKKGCFYFILTALG